MKRHRSFLIVAALLVLASCAPDRAVAPDPLGHDVRIGSVSFARPGATNPTLRFTIDDLAIASDRQGAYTNGTCGVFAVINLATNNALFDPDGDYKAGSGCTRRTLQLTLPGGQVSDASYVTIGATYSSGGVNFG